MSVARECVCASAVHVLLEDASAVHDELEVVLWSREQRDVRERVSIHHEQVGEGARSYRSVTWAATITCGYCMPEENGVPVYVARLPKVPPRDLWSSVQHYD